MVRLLWVFAVLESSLIGDEGISLGFEAWRLTVHIFSKS